MTTHVRFLFGGNPKAQHLYLAAQNVVTERYSFGSLFICLCAAAAADS